MIPATLAYGPEPAGCFSGQFRTLAWKVNKRLLWPLTAPQRSTFRITLTSVSKKRKKNRSNLLALSANCACVQNFRPSAYFNRRLQHSWKLHTSIWPFPRRDLQVSIRWDDKEHSGIITDKVRYLPYKVQHSQVAWISFESRWQIKKFFFSE
jgi:hypothetical protein